MADVVYSTIIKIEPGTIQNPTIETMAKIVKTLGAPIEDLIK